MVNIFDNFTNNIKFISGILIAFVIIILNHRYYVPYFFPELNDLRDDKIFILTNKRKKQDLLLIKGLLPFNNNEIIFNTTNKYSRKYVKMSKSMNNPNGTEMTYSFWINKNSAQSSEYADRVILLKGLKGTDVSCPIIKFGDTSDKLIIGFNTSDGLEEVCIGESCNVPSTFNITGGDRWYLITVVLQDYRNPDDNFEEGINVLVYLNGSLINSGTVLKGKSLKTNNSPLYILPNVNDNNYNSLSGSIADITYHNYALDQIEINKMYNTSINQVPFKTALDLKIQNNESTSDRKFDLQLMNEL